MEISLLQNLELARAYKSFLYYLVFVNSVMLRAIINLFSFSKCFYTSFVKLCYCTSYFNLISNFLSLVDYWTKPLKPSWKKRELTIDLPMTEVRKTDKKQLFQTYSQSDKSWKRKKEGKETEKAGRTE